MRLGKYILAAMLLSTTLVCAQKKKARPTTAKTPTANTMSAKQKELFESMLPNTQKIFVIDSIVVDKDKVAENIPLPSDYGRLISYDDFFGKGTKSGQYVFVNGFGDKCYYTELGNDSIQRLFTRDRLGDGWSEPKELSEIDGNFHDISFPFMSSDGQTLYFAGTSNEGLGKRDIYMAKYNAEEGSFFEPENIGLPFNSTDDDFLYVEADADRLAWFASSRRQPSGKACIYVFILPEQRKNYSGDDLPEAKLKSLASLIRIRETWPTPEIRERAMKHLESLRSNAAKKVGVEEAMRFVVNDDVTYTNVSDFRSDMTRQQYYEVVRLGNDIKSKQKTLDNLRLQYHNAKSGEREKLGRDILRLEEQIEQVQSQLRTTTNGLRAAESKLLERR